MVYTRALGPFDGVVDFDGASGVGLGHRFEQRTVQESFTQPSALAAWLDSDPSDGVVETLDFEHAVSEQFPSSSTGCAACTVLVDPFAGLELAVVYELAVPGEPFCAGDGSATACPCGNASTAGSFVGCLHSGGAGGELRSEGAPSLGADSLVLVARDLTGPSALFVQGTALENGGAGSLLGDGLACVGETLVRLGTAAVTGGTARLPVAGTASLSARGHVAAPGLRSYQVHFRDPAAYCTPATVNLSNGLWLDWR
jgi:hypothetical protein